MNAVSNIIDFSLVGVGLYTPAQAELYTGIRSRRLRDWIKGYKREGRQGEPLWHSDIKVFGETFLSFRDLNESRVVQAFLKQGISLQAVRKAIDIAQTEYGITHPLATQRFKTDGKHIFLEASRQADEKLVEIFSGQFQFAKIIEQSLKNIDYDEAGIPLRWHIARSVVLDPSFSFGQPVEAETLVPTSVLSEAVKSEGSIKAAALAFMVNENAVKSALAFEKSIEKAK